MGVALVLVGIFVAVIGAPIALLIEYRRLVVEERARSGQDRWPEAQVTGSPAGIYRFGAVAHRHRTALRAAVFRRLVPAWAIGLGLMLLGVLLSKPE